MSRFAIPLAVFVVILAFLFVGLGLNPREVPSPLIGKPAPVFELPTVADPAVRISNRDYAGSMYLLNVWGTWCGGCREEHEMLLEIARVAGIPMLGLNWKDDRLLAMQWLTQLGNPYAQVASDTDGRVAIDWGVYGAPETLLVSADGVILAKRIGVMTADIWQRDFLPLIAQGRGRSVP